METGLWVAGLIAGVFATHWGAEKLSAPLKKTRQQWGLSPAGEATFAGLAAASPEVAMAVVSAFRGVGAIGLGTTIGTNIIAIPLVVSIVYVGAHLRRRASKNRAKDKPSPKSGSAAGEEEPEQPEGELLVRRQAATVQAIPYLGIVALLALLTLPEGWRGLQPVDGWILLGAYALYLAQALLRKRDRRQGVKWERRELWLTGAGLLVLAAGAYVAILATEHIAEALGLSEVVGGLLIAAPMACLPELFEAWSLARDGQVNPAVMSVIGDHAVTLTLGMLPLALLGLPVEMIRLYAFNLGLVALMPLLYAVFILTHGRPSGFKLGHMLVLDALLLAWVLVVLLGQGWLEG
jgi:cation:H+ antiporter